MTVNPPIDMRRESMANPWQNICFQLPVSGVSDPKDYLQYRVTEPTPSCDRKPKIAFSIDSIVGNEELPCDEQLTPSTPTNKAPFTPQRTPSPSSSAPTPETPVSPRLFPQHSSAQPHFQWPPVHHVPQNQPQILEALNHLRAIYGGEAQLPPHVAAAVGLRQQIPHPVGLQPLPNFAGVPSVQPMMQPSNPLYPWLLARQGRFFGQRFPPGPEMAGFLLAPFRKPKRVRTAFSPSQLLKLESAFDKNHYVVGAERKQLAQALNLSETQVKVWFQNRRTKHKRVVQDGPEDGGKSEKRPGDLSDMRSEESDIDESDMELDIEDENHC